MFCPKCGKKNPDDGRFCRSCGADLGDVSKALTGELSQKPIVDRRGRSVSYESAITKIFTGIAFLIVALILGYTGKFGASVWWFWMLIPAFGSLGSGVAQYFQLKKSEQRLSFNASDNIASLNSPLQNKTLPSSQTDFNEIQRLLQSGNKIEAIKIHRERFGSSLAEAKQAVEKIEREQSFQNDYQEPPRGSIYDTGELEIPSSVTENTTRHLEIDKEGETMTLPKNNL